MNESEDTLEIFEAKEKAYDEGFLTGLLFGIPAGTIGTLLIAWFTQDQWLPLIK